MHGILNNALMASFQRVHLRIQAPKDTVSRSSCTLQEAQREFGYFETKTLALWLLTISK